MRTLLTSICCLLMAACSFHTTEIYGIGKTTTVRVGGDGASSNSILGDADTDKNSTAFKAFINGMMTLATGYFAHDSIKIQEGTKQLANAGANKVQIEQARFAAQTASEQLKAGQNSEAIKAKLFQEGAAIWKQQ